MMRKSWIVLGLLAAVGCDDGDGGGGITIDTQVEDSKKISALTDEEAKQFCDAVAAQTQNIVSTQKICELVLASAAPTPEACQMALSDCVQSLESGDADPSDDTFQCDVTDASKRATCDATVAEFEACMSDFVNLSRQFLSQVTCSIAGNAAKLAQLESSAPKDPQAVASCRQVAEACPDIFPPEDMDDPQAGNN